MSLFLLTGPVRSGKSVLAQRLAEANATEFVVAVAGRPDDAEMARRIERHKADRGEGWKTLELTPGLLAGPDGPAAWLVDVPRDHVLVLDCLGTLVSSLMDGLGDAGHGELADPEAERRVQEAVDAVVEALLARPGLAIVVSNEVGWGVVPAHPAGRLFRDVMGRANRALAARADIALLVVAGRVISLTDHPTVEEF
jgi:adenosylcobinamide kinase / adenosylcobinamide-phosphate guanylyltransferase